MFWSSPLNVSTTAKKDKLNLKLEKEYFARKDVWFLHKEWEEPKEPLYDGPLDKDEEEDEGRRMSSINGRDL